MDGTLTPPVVTVFVSGDVDVATCGEMRDKLTAALNGGPVHLEADLSGVTFIDAAGIGVLVDVHHQATAAGGTLTLRSPSWGVRRLTGVLGLDGILPVAG